MRCEDLIRELASPTGRLTPAEMAGHLADCPGCAERSRRAAHLDRIWEATRPDVPSEAALDALWASASLAIDAQLAPATLQFENPGRRRRAWAKPVFLAAQAAAILGAAVFLLRQGDDRPVKVAVVTPETVKVDRPPIEDEVVMPLAVNVEFGETAIVTIGDEAGDHRIHLLKEPTPNSSAIPENTQFDVSRGVEAMLEDGDLGKVVSR